MYEWNPSAAHVAVDVLSHEIKSNQIKRLTSTHEKYAGNSMWLWVEPVLFAQLATHICNLPKNHANAKRKQKDRIQK